MCLIYLGNITEVVIILKNSLTWCDDFLSEKFMCSTGKLLRENIFFVTSFMFSKFLIILFAKN